MSPKPTPRPSIVSRSSADPEVGRLDDHALLTEEVRHRLAATTTPVILPAPLDPDVMANEMDGFLTVNNNIEPDTERRVRTVELYHYIAEAYQRFHLIDARLKKPKSEVAALLREVGEGIEPGFAALYVQYSQALEAAIAEIMSGIKQSGVPYFISEEGERTEPFTTHLETMLRLMGGGWTAVSEPHRETELDAFEEERPTLSTLSPTYAACSIDYYDRLTDLERTFLDETDTAAAWAKQQLRRHFAERDLKQEWLSPALEEAKEKLPRPISMGLAEETAHLLTERVMTEELNRLINELFPQPSAKRHWMVKLLRERLFTFIKYHLWAQWRVATGTDRYLHMISPTGKVQGQRWVDKLPSGQRLETLLRALHAGFAFSERQVRQKRYLLLSQS